MNFLILFKILRFNQPTGLFLLLWPTLWALFLSNNGVPSVRLLIIFMLGVIFTRSVGCLINDYVDRDIDFFNRRTMYRVLLFNKIDFYLYKILFFILIVILFLLVIQLSILVIYLSLIALLLIIIYPYSKKYFNFPQLILGITYSWSIPMVFIEVHGTINTICCLLFLANFTWIIAYDTQYAMADIEDDITIGVNSSAILFGEYDKIIIGLLQVTTLIIFLVIGCKMQFNYIFYISLIGSAVLFTYQHLLILDRNDEKCLMAFSNNNFVGILISCGIFLNYIY